MNHLLSSYTNSNLIYTQHTRWERITMDQAPPNDPPLSSQDLSLISGHTIRHYDENAADYWEGTKGHDVRQNTEALLTHMDGPGPYSILDFGCGPGRDLMHFTSLGHEAVGLDGSAELAALARKHSGCEVLHQNFLSLDLPQSAFDGVFANATLSCTTPGAAKGSSRALADAQARWHSLLVKSSG